MNVFSPATPRSCATGPTPRRCRTTRGPRRSSARSGSRCRRRSPGRAARPLQHRRLERLHQPQLQERLRRRDVPEVIIGSPGAGDRRRALGDPPVQSVRASQAVAAKPGLRAAGQQQAHRPAVHVEQYAQVSQAVYTNVNSALSGADHPARPCDQRRPRSRTPCRAVSDRSQADAVRAGCRALAPGPGGSPRRRQHDQCCNHRHRPGAPPAAGPPQAPVPPGANRLDRLGIRRAGPAASSASSRSSRSCSRWR